MGMLRRAQHGVFCAVWWLPILLLVFLHAYVQDSVSNCCFYYRVLIPISVGLSLILWNRAFKLSPWSYLLLLVHCALKKNLYFHSACFPDTANSKRSNRKYKRAYYGNLAFGGRGPPYVVRGYRVFDSTLGYPGEGWAELTVATWNTRSLTYERFQYCNSLNYDILAITELWHHQSRFQTKCCMHCAAT